MPRANKELAESFKISSSVFTPSDKVTRFITTTSPHGQNVQFSELKCRFPKPNDDKDREEKEKENKNKQKVLLYPAIDSSNHDMKDFIQTLNEKLITTAADNYKTWFPVDYQNMVENNVADEDNIKWTVEQKIKSCLKFTCEKDDKGLPIQDKPTDKYYFVFNLPIYDDKFAFPVVDNDGKPYEYDSVNDLENTFMTFIMKVKTIWLNKENIAACFMGYMFHPQKVRVVPNSMGEKGYEGSSIEEMVNMS
jgi:hypothetical protein